MSLEPKTLHIIAFDPLSGKLLVLHIPPSSISLFNNPDTVFLNAIKAIPELVPNLRMFFANNDMRSLNIQNLAKYPGFELLALFPKDPNAVPMDRLYYCPHAMEAKTQCNRAVFTFTDGLGLQWFGPIVATKFGEFSEEDMQDLRNYLTAFTPQ